MRLIQIKFLVVIIFLLLVCSCNNRSIPKGDTVFGQVALIENKEYSITDLQIGYKDGSLSVESVVQFYLQRIENIDDSGPLLNAVITTNSNALKMARQLDQDLLKGVYRGPMYGVPVLLKDNIDTFICKLVV